MRIHLDVEVDDIDTGRRHVEELGGHFSGTRHDYDEGVVLNMFDPEGHEFCLVQYFDGPGGPADAPSPAWQAHAARRHG